MNAIIEGIVFHEKRADGLEELKLLRLGKYVVLAGPNGAGKTRILKTLFGALDEYSKGPEKYRERIANAVQNLARARPKIAELSKSIKALSAISEMPAAGQKLTERDLDLAADLNQKQQTLQSLLSIAEGDKKELSELVDFSFDTKLGDNSIHPLWLNLSNEKLKDPHKLRGSRRQALRQNSAERKPFSEPALGLVEIADATNRYVAAIHPLVSSTDIKKERREEEIFRTLCANVTNLTGLNLAVGDDLQPTIDGRALSEATALLSTGQKRLIAFCGQSVHEPAIDNNTLPYIVFIDEPELYVHNGALIGMLDTLSRQLPNAQFFIATHSVPLIAHLGHENVWWMNAGLAQYAGKQTSVVLEGLLGGSENVAKVQALTLEPSRLAAVTFAAQCLLPPPAADYRKGDPQAAQILDSIRRVYGSQKLRVLDWGAGDGRIYRCLVEELGAGIEETIDYVGFEPDEEKSCPFDPAIGNRWFSKSSHIFGQFSEGSFDKIVLCNVLHEILPAEWAHLFTEFRKLLGNKGTVLIVEDTEIPHGELPTHVGYLLTDQMTLRYLFQVDSDLAQFPSTDPRYHDRLSAIEIPSDALGNISTQTISRALQHVQEQSLRKITELRATQGNKSGEYAKGVTHARLALQYVNAKLGLQSIGVT